MRLYTLLSPSLPPFPRPPRPPAPSHQNTKPNSTSPNPRQIFLHQPNRHFARALSITETQIRLAQYDRGGASITPFHNIHTEPAVFVRLILGLASPDEGVLGLDTSVQWVIDEETGRKVSGTIQVDECTDETIEGPPTAVYYDLDMSKPPVIRPTIRGRGTVCWHATHPTTCEAVLIKDAWRAEGRTSEVEHLRTALGIPGVVRMLAYQDFSAETQAYHPHASSASESKDTVTKLEECTNTKLENRIKLRLVLKKYGESIWYFRTRLELFCAVLDALVGTSFFLSFPFLSLSALP